MRTSIRKLLSITLVAFMAIAICSTESLAGGYHKGGYHNRYGYNNHGSYHGNYYNSNQMWTAVGVGLLGGALIGAASARSAPVYYQEPPPVYNQRPVYEQQPVYVQPPPTSYLRYDPACGCLR